MFTQNTQFLSRYLRIGSLVLLAVLGLSGCVTTEKGSEKRIDKVAAAETRIQLGLKYLQAGNRENARRQFKGALDLNKDSRKAYRGIALVHQLNGEVELAEENYKKALSMKSKTDESKTMVRDSYARFLYQQNRIEEAFAMFQEASDDLDYPKRPQVVYFVGLCAEKLNNTVRAKAAYKHSINLSPRMAPAMLALAQIHFAEGEYAESKRMLDRFSSITKHTAQSLWLGIRIEKIFGNKDKEASYALMLKNMHAYSKEYLEYKKNME